MSRPRKPYVLTLRAVGNPDFGQGRTIPGVRARKVRVATFQEASFEVLAYIEDHNLGGGNWPGGELRDHTGAAVGRVSFNGKVWPPGPWVSGQAPLWPPMPYRCSCCGETFASSKPPDPERDYGYGTCEGCHERVAASWAEHGFPGVASLDDAQARLLRYA